ncbi:MULTISPECIES: GNAT family N-acetyltransferase [unclassified Micromonospora]|uniref:GNAT family N-acetyltransferase n=1 Tax=unclassified Micromonospora TaxID=2617518 RepID=UPI001B3747FA|nr:MULTISPECIES: GNAT family N-acetyltransferase [unclassified Micromonospora]MBQ1041369.1 GNAT family N-acetyltransferase [Micromonospora sp. C72]MBQ1054831.1 GNAT family N-acetyltransferase [Micromonospora sp. C32]
MGEHEELTTARLRLRRPTRDDVDLIHALHTDSRACAHNPSDLLADRAEAGERFRRWDAHWRRHGFGYWSVCRDDRPVGFCGLKLMRLHDSDVLNLFYRLDPAVWGDGVAGEAATAVVAWAAAHRPELPVVARIRPANTASERVARRAGLHRAAHLDTPGEDGPDLIYVSRRP